MKFDYFASGEEGKIAKGTIEADSRVDALEQLKSNGLAVINLRLSQPTKIFNPQRFKVAKTKPLATWWDRFHALEASFGRVKLTDKVNFVNNLNLMLKSGVGLAEAITTLKNQTEAKFFRNILNHIEKRIKNGVAFSTALSYYNKIFPPLFINIIRVGEESGKLEDNLLYLAEELEKRIIIHKKIKGAMLYPTVVLSAGIMVATLVIYYILPQLKGMFETLNVELPWTTILLIKISKILENYGIIILFLFICGIILTKYLITKTPLRYFYYFLLVRGPLVGKIVRYIALTNITRTLYTLLQSGIPIINAINITQDVTSNLLYRNKLQILAQNVNKGEPIFKSLKTISLQDPKLFPLMIVTTIEVGEKTGRLREVLDYLAKYYEREVDNILKNLSTLLEPILLLLMGTMVAYLAISIIMPLYSMTSAI